MLEKHHHPPVLILAGALLIQCSSAPAEAETGTGGQPHSLGFNVAATEVQGSHDARVPPSSHLITLGGVTIDAPAPNAELFEVGDSLRHYFETFAPNDSEIVAAYLPPADLTRLSQNQLGSSPFDHYATILRFCESGSGYWTPEEFEQLRALAKENLSAICRDGYDDAIDEINQRLSDRYGDSSKLDVTEPIPLGLFVDDPQAFGYGMLTMVRAHDATLTMAAGTAMVYIRGRIFFLNYYLGYHSVESINDLKVKIQQWTTKIIDANTQQ